MGVLIQRVCSNRSSVMENMQKVKVQGMRRQWTKEEQMGMHIHEGENKVSKWIQRTVIHSATVG